MRSAPLCIGRGKKERKVERKKERARRAVGEVVAIVLPALGSVAIVSLWGRKKGAGPHTIAVSGRGCFEPGPLPPSC